MESYFSRYARVLESVMSFTATNSIAESPSAARRMFRPIRPKPLMPTLTGILPPKAWFQNQAGPQSVFEKSDTRATIAATMLRCVHKYVKQERHIDSGTRVFGES